MSGGDVGCQKTGIVMNNINNGAVTLVAVLIGATAGPTLVALIADFVFRDEKRLGTSLAIVVAVLMPIAVALFRTALRPFVEARTPPPPAERRPP